MWRTHGRSLREDSDVPPCAEHLILLREMFWPDTAGRETVKESLFGTKFSYFSEGA